MDPTNPIPESPEILNQTGVSKTPNFKNSLVLIMSILLIVTVAIAGLFYFQIQKFSKELSKYQTQPSPLVSPEPSAEAETANWKTYSNTKYGYSFKYPPDWIIEPDKQAPDEIINISKDLNSLSIYAGSAFTKAPEGKAPSKRRGIKIAGIDAVGEYYDNLYELISFAEKRAVNTIALRYAKGLYSEDVKNFFDQILSTFKFLDSSTLTQGNTCGGWDTSGEILCTCTGQLIKPTCPPNAQCDGASYTCTGQCDACCYKGIFENSKYPRCQ